MCVYIYSEPRRAHAARVVRVTQFHITHQILSPWISAWPLRGRAILGPTQIRGRGRARAGRPRPEAERKYRFLRPESARFRRGVGGCGQRRARPSSIIQKEGYGDVVGGGRWSVQDARVCRTKLRVVHLTRLRRDRAEIAPRSRAKVAPRSRRDRSPSEAPPASCDRRRT